MAAVFTATVFELDAVGISVFESLHPSEFIGHEVVTMAAVLSTSLLLLVSAISLRRRIGILEIERDFLKQMVEGEPACVKLVSKDMKLLEMNPAGLNMIGAPSLDAVRGADLSEVVHPDFIGVFRELNERVFAGESRTERFRIISLDGTHRWMESHAAPLFGRDGEVTAHLAVTYDVSERMEIEQRLEASTSRLNALIDTAADGVLVLSSDGVIERLNPAATSLFEARPGENFADLIGDDNDRHGGSENFSDLVARYRRESSSELLRLSFEETGRKSSGDTFPMLVSFGEVAQGAGGGFVVTVHDLTSRLRTQAQLAQAQKMEAVGQLSGGIAHDFNNLLTVIMGNAQLLEESSEHDAPDEERLEASSMIMEAGERGVALTQRLLAFGRRQVLQPVSTQCDVLVRDMQGWLKRTLRDDISVRVRLDSGLYPIFADRSQLDTALLNLAINAQDALPHGGQLTLSAYNLTLHEEEEARALNLDPGTYVVLSVTDDGAGMSDAVKTKALEPFFTTKDVGKGTGLGLSMVYGFAKQSGGHLTIKSEQGVGTTVGIYLPADTASVTGRNNAELFSAIRRSEEHERHRGAKILVVEDDALVRAYVSRCLRSLGYQALTAHDGVEGLMLLDSVPDIDMVITDAVMPGGMSGIELSDRAAERHSGIP
ncbi:MAG: PAS domain S-box protein, partial [Nannocystaceae bacterium]